MSTGELALPPKLTASHKQPVCQSVFFAGDCDAFWALSRPHT